MEFTGSCFEAKTLLRSVKNAVEEVKKTNPNKKFNATFAITLAKPHLGKTDSEVLSLLSSINDALSKFASQEALSVRLEIQEYGGVDAQIIQKTQENFEAATKLAKEAEEGAKKAVGAGLSQAK